MPRLCLIGHPYPEVCMLLREGERELAANYFVSSAKHTNTQPRKYINNRQKDFIGSIHNKLSR